MKKKIGFLVVIIIFLFLIIGENIIIKSDPLCVVVPCELNGENCVCCLIYHGTIGCGPCGAFDCTPISKQKF